MFQTFDQSTFLMIMILFSGAQPGFGPLTLHPEKRKVAFIENFKSEI